MIHDDVHYMTNLRVLKMTWRATKGLSLHLEEEEKKNE